MLRVALVAGSLTRGGAEKQLLAVADALLRLGLDVRVCSLTRGEAYEQSLKSLGLDPLWIGRRPQPPVRLAAVVRALSPFRPHVVQSSHAFANLYAAMAAQWLGAGSVGALRSSLAYCRAANGAWTHWLLRAPTMLATNSESARAQVVANRLKPASRVYVLPNVVDLPARGEQHRAAVSGPLMVMTVTRLVPGKGILEFLKGLAAARRAGVSIRGVVVGDGPERSRLETAARELHLSSEEVSFVGELDDVPALLRQADAFVLCSEDEGTPNALLEAMALGLPVLATPVGDVGALVVDGQTGFLVPVGDGAILADRLRLLASSAELRERLGCEARRLVAVRHGRDRLPDRLLELYRMLGEVVTGSRLRQALRWNLDGASK